MFLKGIKTKVKNYSPISLLPLTISKVTEKWIHNQTQGYLQRNESMYIYQTGHITAHHSIDTYLSRLTDIILNGPENRKHAGMILIDL